MITPQEYRTRMTCLQNKLPELGLDAFIITGQNSIYYFTGISYEPLERPFFIIVTPGKPSALLVPALEQDHLRSAPNIGDVHHYWDYPSPRGRGWPEKIAELISGHRTVGCEPGLSQEIAGALKGTTLKAMPVVENLRLVKTDAEVGMIRQAARYADMAVEKVIGTSYYGVSEIELFSQGRKVLVQIMKDIGFDVLTTTILAGAWTAPLSAQPHGIPKITDRLREGPHIAIGFDRVFGYAAECERTFFTAKPTDQMKAVFSDMRESRALAYTLVRPGARCDEIDAAVQDFLKGKGYGEYLLHRTGHGFGLGNHEGPWVAEGSSDILAKNMIISIEPGIYLPGIGGFRHSDTVLVTDSGYENLTVYPTDLESVTIRAKKPVKRIFGALIRRAVGIK